MADEDGKRGAKRSRVEAGAAGDALRDALSEASTAKADVEKVAAAFGFADPSTAAEAAGAPGEDADFDALLPLILDRVDRDAKAHSMGRLRRLLGIAFGINVCFSRSRDGAAGPPFRASVSKVLPKLLAGVYAVISGVEGAGEEDAIARYDRQLQKLISKWRGRGDLAPPVLRLIGAVRERPQDREAVLGDRLPEAFHGVLSIDARGLVAPAPEGDERVRRLEESLREPELGARGPAPTRRPSGRGWREHVDYAVLDGDLIRKVWLEDGSDYYFYNVRKRDRNGKKLVWWDCPKHAVLL